MAAGTAAKDAVNLGQLQGLGATVDSSGNVTNSFVAYDDTTKGKVTFGGKGSTTPVTLANVAAGKAGTDAVNVNQLEALGGKLDSLGNATNAFVAYDNASKAAVTLGGTNGTQIHNVAAGTAAKDAVNLGQLQGLGATVDSSGNVTNSFVAYDDTTKGKVTFGGKGSTTPVTLANVAAGKADTDAVNVKQLNDIGVKTDSSGNVTNPFVAYDDATKAAITLGGTNGTQIHNVAAGTAAKDAVNLGQLQGLGATVDSSGNVTNSFVAYDDTTKGKVTFGGKGSTTPVVLANVAAGKAGTDAVNVNQLNAIGVKTDSSGNPTNAFVAYDNLGTKDKVTLEGTSGTKITNLTAGDVSSTSKDAINGSQLYKLGSTTAAALGGGAALNPDGTIKAPTYNVAGTDYADVGKALDAVAKNGAGTDSVKYDTPSHDKITLGGTAAPAPVKLTNVADGVDATDAATVGQLNTLATDFKSVNTSLKYVRFGASVAATAQASGTDSVAIGGNAFANAAGALAIGRDSVASGRNSVAIGIGSQASQANVVSFGSATVQRRLTQVADGQDDNDAVNLGQVTQLIADSKAKSTRSLTMMSQSVTQLAASTITPADMIKAGPTDKQGQIEALGTDSVAIGLNTHANGDQSVAIGTNTSAGREGSVAIGNSAVSSGVGSTAIGVNAEATNGARALAIGNYAQSGSTDSIVIGNNSNIGDTANATTDNAIAVGSKNLVKGANSVVLGNNVSVTGTSSFVLGSNTKVAGVNSVILGAGSDGSQSNVVSVGAKDSERKIVNVATGTGDTDAVNVKQLNDKVAGLGTGGGTSLVTQSAADQDVLVAAATAGTHVNFAGTAGPRELTGVAAGTGDNSAATVGQLKPAVAALGGGAAVGADGKVTGPTYNVQGGTQNNVGAALGALDSGLNDVKTQIGKVGTSLVTQDTPTSAITVGALTGGTELNIANKDGVARKITNVAAGDVSSDSLNAINGSQLFSAGQGLATAIGGGAALNKDGSITQPTFVVGGTSVHNVGDALSNIDGRVTSNTTDIAGIKQTLTTIGSSANSVSYDSTAHDKVTLGGTAATTSTSLTNLTDANLSATSTDAVTGKQLFATNAKVDELGTAIKNVSTTGSSVVAVGPIGSGSTGPAPTATGSGSLAVGNGANAGGDGSLALGNGAGAAGNGGVAVGAGSSSGGKDSLALGHNAKAPADNAVALGANSVADQPNTVSIGSEGNERRLTNVAPGINGTDAVNMNQLGAVQSGLNDVARKSYGGIAAATALTMIPDVDANKTLSIGVGGGTYRGYAATAIGGTARITQNIKVRVGAGWSSSGTTVGAGASYQW
ncbi:YadA domain-containing protein [Caballeronia choica]|uniref:YadA domain-containing protein n=1 Tax=Caballeronia choica TaxID=326476 RepID=A0A158JZN1_9BURK|nr:YadA domain-containing protein [Caballeronia choica]